MKILKTNQKNIKNIYENIKKEKNQEGKEENKLIRMFTISTVFLLVVTLVMPAISMITARGTTWNRDQPEVWDNGHQELDYKMPKNQPHYDSENAGAVLKYKCKVKQSTHWWGNKYKIPKKIKLYLKVKSYDDHLVEDNFLGGRIWASDQTPHDKTFLSNTNLGFLNWGVTIPGITIWDAKIPDPDGGDAKWVVSNWNPSQFIDGWTGSHQWYLVGQGYYITDSSNDDLDGKARVKMKQQTYRSPWGTGLIVVPGGTKTYDRSHHLSGTYI